MEIILNDKNFTQEVINSEIPVIVDFWATWCGPCQMLAPEIDKIAEKYAGKIKICKLNVDECAEIAVKYSVEVIPTLIMFNKGIITEKSSGYMKADEIISVFKLKK